MNILTISLLIITASALVWLIILVGKMSSNIEKVHSKLEKINNKQLISSLNESLNSLSDQLTQLSQNSEDQWYQKASNIDEQEKKLEYYEAAARRFADKKRFIQHIRDILEPLASKGDNLLVRREALMRLRDHANRFARNCSLGDFNYALQFRQQVINSMESIVDKIDQLRAKNIKELISELETKIAALRLRPEEKELLEDIEKVDKKINQNVLKDFPKQEIKYNNLSNSLVKILQSNRKDNGIDNKKKNINAVNRAKKAIELMQNHSEGKMKDKVFGPDNPTNYNKRTNLMQLVKLISAYDTNNMIPTTNNYIRMAEAQIFSNLSSDGKKLFSKLMIEETYK